MVRSRVILLHRPLGRDLESADPATCSERSKPRGPAFTVTAFVLLALPVWIPCYSRGIKSYRSPRPGATADRFRLTSTRSLVALPRFLGEE